MNLKALIADEVSEELMGKVPSRILRDVREATMKVLSKYTIENKRDISGEYNGVYPDCYYEYFEALDISGISKKSIDLYRLRINQFFSKVKIPIKDLKTSDMRTYIQSYKEDRNIEGSTQNNIIHILKAFFTWCFNEGYLDRNPMQNIRPVKCEQKMLPYLDTTQIEIVRDGCSNLRDRAFVEFLYSTGCRISEVCSLNISDLDFDEKVVRVKGKGNKWRKCYLKPRCCLVLQRYLESRSDKNESLFVSLREPHGRIKKEGMESMLRKLGEKLEIPFKLTPHVFRRTMATHASQSGMHVEDVKELLGHSSIEMSLRYIRIDHEDLKHRYIRQGN